jgi:hypothetical protein
VKRRKVESDTGATEVPKTQRLTIKPPKLEAILVARTHSALLFDSVSSLLDSEHTRSIEEDSSSDISIDSSLGLTIDDMVKKKPSLSSDAGDHGYDPTDPPTDPTELAIWICGNVNALRASPYEHAAESTTPTTPSKKRHFDIDKTKDAATLAKDQKRRENAKIRKAKSRARPGNWLQSK